jgi:hypothetical protein
MKRWSIRVLLGIVAIVLAGAGYAFARFGDVPAHIVARLACPAIFIEGRDGEFSLARAQSLGVFPFDVRSIVTLTADEGTRSVVVRSFGFFESVARHYPGEGCVME